MLVGTIVLLIAGFVAALGLLHPESWTVAAVICLLLTVAALVSLLLWPLHNKESS